MGQSSSGKLENEEISGREAGFRSRLRLAEPRKSGRLCHPVFSHSLNSGCALQLCRREPQTEGRGSGAKAVQGPRSRLPCVGRIGICAVNSSSICSACFNHASLHGKQTNSNGEDRGQRNSSPDSRDGLRTMLGWDSL